LASLNEKRATDLSQSLHYQHPLYLALISPRKPLWTHCPGGPDWMPITPKTGFLLANPGLVVFSRTSVRRQTPRWREPDSNRRYRVTRPRFEKGSCRHCLSPNQRIKSARTRTETTTPPGAFRGTDGSNPASSTASQLRILRSVEDTGDEIKLDEVERIYYLRDPGILFIEAAGTVRLLGTFRHQRFPRPLRFGKLVCSHSDVDLFCDGESVIQAAGALAASGHPVRG
jgi:hypothetical protein